MKLAIHGGLHLYSSLPEPEQTFARKCINYRDKRVGKPTAERKEKLGEIFFDKTPVKLRLSSFTAIHIFPALAFEDGHVCDLDNLWNNDDLLSALSVWEPPTNWRHVWKLEKRFNNDGLLLFHDKTDFCGQYIQFHETGAVEAVDHELHSWSLTNSRIIPAAHWENGILSMLPPLLSALKAIGGGTPAAICISIRDELEYASVSYEHDAVKRTNDSGNRHRLGIKDGLLVLPLTIVSTFDEDIAVLLRPCFNALARAGGLPGSPRYGK